MFAACLRLLFYIILSPRRLLIAALLATFFYAALVAAKAQLFPESGLTAGRAERSGEQVYRAPGRNGGHGVAVAHGARE